MMEMSAALPTWTTPSFEVVPNTISSQVSLLGPTSFDSPDGQKSPNFARLCGNLPGELSLKLAPLRSVQFVSSKLFRWFPLRYSGCHLSLASTTKC
jgi:hypothetical protein